MASASDLPTFETLSAISNRLSAVCDEIEGVAMDVEAFLGEYRDTETGRVITGKEIAARVADGDSGVLDRLAQDVATLEQIGALHSFRELLEMDRDDLAGNIEKLAGKLIELNLSRLDAAVQRA